MDIEEILEDLEFPMDGFPRAAVEAAIERGEEIIPALLSILEETLENPQDLDVVENYFGHLFALYLLAQFRETRAYPLVVRLANLPPDDLDNLCGDFVTDGLAQVLASVCDGNLSGIKSIIENAEAEEFARWSAIDSLVALVAAGIKSREEIISYFATLFRGGLEREPSAVWDGLVSGACDLWPGELLEDINRAFVDDLVEQSMLSMSEVQEQFETGLDATLARLSNDANHRLVQDTVAEFGDWACFQHEDRPTLLELPSINEKSYLLPKADQIMLPVRSEGPKIGRNDPCPCGSGKKYKKCCLP